MGVRIFILGHGTDFFTIVQEDFRVGAVESVPEYLGTGYLGPLIVPLVFRQFFGLAVCVQEDFEIHSVLALPYQGATRDLRIEKMVKEIVRAYPEAEKSIWSGTT